MGALKASTRREAEWLWEAQLPLEQGSGVPMIVGAVEIERRLTSLADGGPRTRGRWYKVHGLGVYCWISRRGWEEGNP